MKKLISLLLLGLVLMFSPPASAQYRDCNETAILNCDSTLTVTIPHSDNIAFYQVYVYDGITANNSPVFASGSLSAAPSGNTVWTSPAISPSLSQYSIVISRFYSLNPVSTQYPCNPITVVWFDSNANGSVTSVPAKLGYQYQAATQPLLVTTCSTQSAASFITGKRKKRH